MDKIKLDTLLKFSYFMRLFH